MEREGSWSIARKRKIVDRMVTYLTMLCMLVAMAPLVSIVFSVFWNGGASINLEFLTHLPSPVGEPGGGIANAIQGSFIVVSLACLISLPVAIMTGVYLAEYGNNKVASGVRFVMDVMVGTPSIIAGLFGYLMVVAPLRSWSALAGGAALSLLMIPFVTRTVEQSLRLVPLHIREASLALGVRRWKTIASVVMVTAKQGIIVGILLALARIMGEAAPLLFTSGISETWTIGILNQPTLTLSVLIYVYALSPFTEWHAKAWGAALLLLLMVLSLNIAVKFYGRRGISWT